MDMRRGAADAAYTAYVAIERGRSKSARNEQQAAGDQKQRNASRMMEKKISQRAAAVRRTHDLNEDVFLFFQRSRM
jgi:hypothetical protein